MPRVSKGTVRGYRFCTADIEYVIHSVHHTEAGAGRFVKANPHIAHLHVYQFPQPWAVVPGDTLPSAASHVPGDWHNVTRTKRKRIGE